MDASASLWFSGSARGIARSRRTGAYDRRRGARPQTIEGERYEEFEWSWKPGKRIQYDYRHTNGRLFSTIAPTLDECRRRRDRWLAEGGAAPPPAIDPHVNQRLLERC